MSFMVTEWNRDYRPDNELELEPGSPRYDVICRRGELALESGRPLEAERYFTWLQDPCREVPEYIECRALAGLGRIFRLRGQAAEAETYLGRAWDLAVQFELHDVMDKVAYDKGLCAVISKDMERARELFLSTVSVAQSSVSYEVGMALLGLANIAAHNEEWSQVENLSERAERVLRKCKEYEGQIRAMLLLATALMQTGRNKRARKVGIYTVRSARRRRMLKLAATAAIFVGDLAVSMGRVREAEGRYRWAVDTATRSNADNVRGKGLLRLGRLARDRGEDMSLACSYLREAIDMLNRTQDRESLQEALTELVPLCRGLGDVKRAQEYGDWLKTIIQDRSCQDG